AESAGPGDDERGCDAGGRSGEADSAVAADGDGAPVGQQSRRASTRLPNLAGNSVRGCLRQGGACSEQQPVVLQQGVQHGAKRGYAQVRQYLLCIPAGARLGNTEALFSAVAGAGCKPCQQEDCAQSGE